MLGTQAMIACKYVIALLAGSALIAFRFQHSLEGVQGHAGVLQIN